MKLSVRTAGQIRRSLFHEGWHGPAVFEVLQGVEAPMAGAKTPVAKHSIWAYVKHMRTWQEAALSALAGQPLPPADISDNYGWDPIPDLSEKAWEEEKARFRKSGETLIQRAAAMDDRRLNEQVPGRAYDIGHLLLGIASHNTYHCGQIVLLHRYLHLHKSADIASFA